MMPSERATRGFGEPHFRELEPARRVATPNRGASTRGLKDREDRGGAGSVAASESDKGQDDRRLKNSRGETMSMPL